MVLSGGLFFCLILALGCGKVTQVTAPQSEIASFDLTISVSLAPTANVRENTRLGQLSLADRTVYSTMYSVSDKKNLTELAWAKSSYTWDPVIPTQSIVSVMRKDGSVLDRAEYKTLFMRMMNNKSWRIEATKVPQGAPYYLMATYADTGKFALRVLPNALVSGNMSMDLPAITPYDTFLAVLYLTREAAVSPNIDFSVIQTVFTPEFFTAMVYAVPTPSVYGAGKSPNWVFERELERQLVRFARLYRIGDREGASQTLAILKKMGPIVTTKNTDMLQKLIGK